MTLYESTDGLEKLESNGITAYIDPKLLEYLKNVGNINVDFISTPDGRNGYAVQVGEGALCGLTSPGHLTVEPIGSLETKDATRTRVKWYVSLALFSSIKAAALIGVKE